MKKSFTKIISALLVLIMMASVISISALTVSASTYNGNCGDGIIWSLDNTTGELVVSGTGDMAYLLYAEAPWYSRRYDIKTVTINQGVTSIANYAFQDCTSLTSISIPESVVSIGYYSCLNCNAICDIYYAGSKEKWNEISFGSNNEKLKQATIHYSLVTGTCGTNLTWSFNESTGTLTILGTGDMDDFKHNRGPWDIYADSIKCVVIGNDVNNIGNYAFINCVNLTDVIIGNGVTVIGYAAFSDCDKLTSIKIPDGVTTISGYAFDDCDNLSNITIGNNVTTIEDYAFARCKSITSISVPNSVTNMGGYIFADCTNLTSVKISDNVTTIGYGVFESCINLTTIIGGNSVITIKENAFHDCDGITSIAIPNSVKRIETDAFGDCDNITDVYFDGTEKEWNKIKIGSSNESLCNATIHFSGCSHSYKLVVTAPTCTEQGYTTYTCECGDTYVADYVDETGHSHTSEITTPATHTATGVMTYTCACGDTYTETIGKIAEHSHNAVVTAPTCTEQGYTTYTCECGDSYVDDYVPEKGHDEGIWSVTKPSTPTESGVMHLFCGECGFVLETKVIPATGKVRGVAISDISLDYKASTTITPSIIVDSDVKYTVTYSSSNPSVASVDANGKVVAGKTGSATITVTVKDEFGNTVSDTCTVKVNYNWWQWIIVIVLFGWIWY